MHTALAGWLAGRERRMRHGLGGEEVIERIRSLQKCVKGGMWPCILSIV